MSKAGNFNTLIEKDIWIASDGTQYLLSNVPERVVLSEEGTGMPPINYVSQRGPFQNGETLRDYFLQPRIVQLIVRHQFCDRAAYWAGRAALLNILRPNRSATGLLCQGVLRKILPGGTIRDLTCIIQQGPTFQPRQSGQWDEAAYTETLRFTAFDPTYFDPVLQTVVFQQAPVATFPMTFPVVFGGFDLTTAITILGTWVTYPTIIVAGPSSKVIITNTTTNQVIEIDYPLPFGSTITLDLTFGHKTVKLQDGTNLIGYVTTASNLVQFQLIPGVNNITIAVEGSGSATTVTFQYLNRYIGI